MARFGRTYVHLGLVRPVQILGALLQEFPSDSEGLSDSLSVTQTHNQVISETVGLTDSLVLTQSESNTISDSEGLTDSLVLTLGQPYNASDSEGLTDNLTVAMTGRATPSDTLGLTDSLVLSGVQGPPGPVSSGYEGDLVLGPATLYIASYGATEPANGSVGSAPDPLVWTDLGGILGGVELSIDQEWIEVELKQLPDKPMKRLKRRRLSIKTQLAEPTLANLAYALNDTAAVTGQVFEPTVRSEASVLSYNALIIDGWAPGFNDTTHKHKRRRLIIRKCLSVDNVQMGYNKEGQTVYTVTWTCHYVNSTTPIFRIVDQA